MLAVSWWAARTRAVEPAVQIRTTPTAIVALDSRGAERWRYRFAAGERLGGPLDGRPDAAEILAGGDDGAIVGISSLVHLADDSIRSGQLFWFTREGTPQRTFSFDDHVRFGAGVYSEPWGMTDFRVQGVGVAQRIAVAAHHWQWWPSVITVLDQEGRRHGTFVNPGWLERVRWLSPTRLVAAGFSEAFDGGVVALLDADAMNGQGPAPADSRFSCLSCGGDQAIRYVVMPRTDVNRATGSRFNRALVEISSDRIIVRTIEVPDDSGGNVADALYEFTPDLDLIRASYSDRYLQIRHELEAQDKLKPLGPNETAPREVLVWDPQTGWRSVQPPGAQLARAGRP